MPYDAISKDPNARLDYVFNWKPFLGGDTIDTSAFPSFPVGITNDGGNTTNDQVLLWLAGGTNGRAYTITNRITTVGGRTMDWVLIVYAEEQVSLPEYPPWVSVADALEYVPQAKGHPSPSVDTDLRRAASYVARWAPREWPAMTTTTDAGTDSQDFIPVPEIGDWEYEGVVRIGSELVQYFGKETELGVSTGPGNLTRAQRGHLGTVPAAFALGAAVEDYGYNLRARDTVIAVFEWLWKTRGFKPSRSAVVGSESYVTDFSAVKAIVREGMGHYYTGGGRTSPALIPTSIPRESSLPQSRSGSSWSPWS